MITTVSSRFVRLVCKDDTPIWVRVDRVLAVFVDLDGDVIVDLVDENAYGQMRDSVDDIMKDIMGATS